MRLRPVGLALLASLAAASQASGQGLRLEPIEGALLLGFDGLTSRPEGVPDSYDRGTLREALLVDLRGSLYSPRLLAFDLSLRPTFRQDRWSDPAGTDAAGSRQLFGSAAVRLLPAGPVSLGFRAHRSEDLIRGRFDQRADSESRGLQLTSALRTAYMSVIASYDRSSGEVAWTSGPQAGVVRVRDQSRLRLRAQSSKTQASFERVETREVERDESVYYRAQVNNRQRWGKGSSLVSRFNYNLREGDPGSEALSWGQSARLQHTRDVYTSLGYNLFGSETRLGTDRGWSVSAGETVRLSPNVGLALSGSFDRRSSEAGRFTDARIQPEANFTLRLPAGARLQGRFGVGYRWRSRETGDGGLAAIVGEVHQVDESNRFFLEQLFPRPSSVRITSEDQVLHFELGIDYRLTESGPLLEVTVLPSGRIQTGDVLLVDYEYEVLPSVEGGSLLANYGLTISLGGLSAYHTRALESPRDEGPTDVAAPLFTESDFLTAGLRYAAPTPLGQLSVGAEWQRAEYPPSISDVYTASAGLGFFLGREWKGRAGARWSLRRNGGRYDIGEIEAAMTWTANPRLALTAEVSGYEWRDDPRRQRFAGLTLGLDWRFAKLTAGVRFDHLTWSYANDKSDDRLIVRLARSF